MLKSRRTKKQGMAYLLSLVLGLGMIAINTKEIELQAEETPACVIDYASMEKEQCEDMYVGEVDSVTGMFSYLYVTGTNYYSKAYEVLNILNQEREAEGLNPLTMDKEMLEIAMLRAAECNVCYGHSRPNGGSYYEPFWGLQGVGYYCGENIAMGQRSSTEVMTAWMSSDGHRDNILSSEYTSVGIGCFRQNNGTYCWVQVFGAGTPTEPSGVSDKIATHKVEIMSAFLTETDYEYDSISIKEGEQVTPSLYMNNQSSSLNATQASFFGVYVDANSFDWVSSNKSIATVSTNGTVTGVKAGSFTVTGTEANATNLELVISGEVTAVGGTSGGDSSEGGNSGGASEGDSSEGGNAGGTSGGASSEEGNAGGTSGGDSSEGGNAGGASGDDSSEGGNAGGASGGGNAGDNSGEGSSEYSIWFAYYQGCDFYRCSDGNVRAFNRSNGELVVDEFKCDGTYTYYFQYDGTAMKDRLTYHPNGVNVIYFDSEGHEVFSDFAHVKTSIEGKPVDDYCFFDVNGYLYVDVVTYDKAGEKLYYANPYGVLERGKWFQFSDTVMCADGTPWNGAAGKYGYANADGTLMVNTWTYDWNGNLVYMEGNGTMSKY